MSSLLLPNSLCGPAVLEELLTCLSHLSPSFLLLLFYSAPLPLLVRKIFRIWWHFPPPPGRLHVYVFVILQSLQYKQKQEDGCVAVAVTCVFVTHSSEQMESVHTAKWFFKSAWIDSNSVQEAYIMWCGGLGKKNNFTFPLSKARKHLVLFSLS